MRRVPTDINKVVGLLFTTNQVVKEAVQVRLVTSAGIIAAKVVKVDAANDLALLKAEGRSVES